MFLTRSTLYAFKLTINSNQGSPLYRKLMEDRNTTTSAFFLATVGLSLSMFSLKQMLSSSAGKRRLQRLH